VVLARMATLAPSLAHLKPIAKPIPLEAPVMTTVFPDSSLVDCLEMCWLIKVRRCMYDVSYW